MKILFAICLFAMVPLLPAYAQSREVKVPGTATGGFGTTAAGPTKGSTPFVAALKVTRPETITILSPRGLVDYGGPGPAVDADGGDYGRSQGQAVALPLDESVGLTQAAYGGGDSIHFAALIGAFVCSSRIAVAGFQPVDATKGIAAAGILPNELFFVGKDHAIEVNCPGTLYLGINDSYAADNSGYFVVNVSSP